MIRAALSSVADTAIIPLQDVLGLGSEARMNLPASESGNWTWRVKPDVMTSDAAARLRELTEASGRT
jgi:4-alpha-glucanotransferase